jgi:three-Cys-motif partner protein
MGHPECKKCRGGLRKENEGEGVCHRVHSVHDGLPVRCVGDWSYEKIYRLVQYFGIFVNGMKRKWEGKLNYIEICSGPGRCVFRESGEEVDGTALAIAQHPSFPILNNAIFIDHSSPVVDALSKRLASVTAQTSCRVRAMLGDFTDQSGLRKVLEALPSHHLNLAFIDPTECNVPFETIHLIADSLRSVDLIINVAVGTDANRNLARAILEPSFANARRKYATFLGSEAFFQNSNNIGYAEAGNHRALRDAFLAEYVAALGRIGFSHTNSKTVKNYYHLLFASRSERGLDFWQKANLNEPSGQRTFGFL